jgi:hypothetical protein
LSGDEHLIGLEDGWAVWRCFCLRSAGFEVGLLRRLTAARTPDALRELFAAEEARDGLRGRLLELTPARGAAEEKRSRKLDKAVRAGQPVAAEPGDPPLVAEWNQACERVAKLVADAERAFADDALRASQHVREVARLPLFREAVLWQNPRAIETGIDPLLRSEAGATGSKVRQKESMVASYLQRYCFKNDTIGFFGPVGWGRFTAEPIFELKPGAHLLARRTVYWEHWAMAALAAAVGEALKPWLAPRRAPTVRVEGTTLFHPIERRSEVPPAFARLLEACDGERTARDIAAALCADETLELADEEEVFRLLDELAEKKLLFWRLELANAGAHPEEALRTVLAAIPDDAAAEARARLADLEEGRVAVARAAGDPVALQPALAHCSETFTRLTGADSRREEGQNYAGRTPLYEDCRRDVELTVGSGVIDHFRAPLAQVLASARWFTWEIARRYREALAGLYHELRGSDAEVDWQRFWQRARALFPGAAAPGSIVADVRELLWSKWEAVLGPIGDQACVRPAAQLWPRVREVFAAPHPGWPAARHHSPDLLFAARDAAALARGEVLCVLGEVHPGFNTVTGLLFVKEHPEPEQLIRWRELDLPERCVAPAWSSARSRADFYSLSRHDLDLEQGDARSHRARAQVLASADLVITEEDGALRVRTRDRRHAFDPIAFLEQHLIAESYAHFSLLRPRSHLPRITVDGLVVQRERWQLTGDELGFAAEETPFARMRAMQRMLSERGMPHQLFLKVPDELKPCFVDLDSPIFVELAARLLRSASAAGFTETLPGITDCWLTDGEGRRYASELRVAARDAERFV